ncbi:hypothetical protein DDB_G0271944 [Dictyostelium discoideum AX4]|uniref:Uncharacterized protein n=1 Tax=Dictyostelium discoideum TaxID=44689 RepID=Q55AD7_DICDI|nr:hypothetical protein DDB_G0271944 [Dictyostelium discoideum AX4]EAL71496.1 hypothetical protein DDB_G0271944 [Dictyostelium discoideum AX4]|eukprot:XP_645419.1 hypothetical protein DDB_G0271944 [Dictyostelium discoideum AX4]
MISLNNCRNLIRGFNNSNNCNNLCKILNNKIKKSQPSFSQVGNLRFYSKNEKPINPTKNKNVESNDDISKFDFKKTEELVKSSNNKNQQQNEQQQQQQQQNQYQYNGNQDYKDDKPLKSSFKDKLFRNGASFIVWGFFSFGIAVYLASHDDTEFIIKNIDSTMKKLKTLTDYELLKSKLAELSELSSKNTTLKKLLSNPEYITQLLDIILEYSDLEINNKSAKIIENASEFINDYSIIPKLLEVAELKYIPSYVKKTLGSAISKIALKGDDEARLKLASNGAIEFLDSMMSIKDFKCQLFKSALLAISSTLENIPTTITSQNEKRKELVTKYAAEERLVKGNVLELKKRELIQSGYHLYLHTSAGGFVWGCIESIRNKLPLRAILLNGCKNSIITAALPIIFVGLMTTYTNETIKKLDTTKEKFEFYFAGFYSLFPWYYILPIVEKFSPYWIGGHVLGFMSFFSYLAYSEYDIFKSDTILIEKDRLALPREVLIENLKKNENKSK